MDSIFKSDFKELEAKIDVRIEKSKSDMIKWFVSLLVSVFVALALMIIGLYIKK